MLKRRRSIMGGGAAAAPTAAALPRPVRTYTLEELSRRADVLALAVGARITVSALLLACVVVILVGAQSLLGTMEEMDRDIKEMNEQMAIANGGLKVLNTTMDSVPPTSRHLGAIVRTVKDTSTQIKVSSKRIDAMATSTGTLDTQLGHISGSTRDMRGSLEHAAGGTRKLSSTIATLNSNMGPLVKTHHQMFTGVGTMRGQLDSMNSSLAYTIRIMNYIAAPPTGGPMTIRADLPKKTLPPIPGIRAEVKPIPVFPRNIWSPYTGP